MPSFKDCSSTTAIPSNNEWVLSITNPQDNPQAATVVISAVTNSGAGRDIHQILVIEPGTVGQAVVSCRPPTNGNARTSNTAATSSVAAAAAAYHVESTAPVVAIVIVQDSDGSLLVPEPALGQSYVVGSFVNPSGFFKALPVF